MTRLVSFGPQVCLLFFLCFLYTNYRFLGSIYIMKVQGGLEWSATTKTGPNDETSVSSFGPLVCVFCFCLSCFINSIFFFIYFSSIYTITTTTTTNDAPPPHEQHGTSTVPPQPNDEGCGEETSNDSGGLETRHVSSPRYVSHFFSFFFSINDVSNYR
jgi:hypothetical protein